MLLFFASVTLWTSLLLADCQFVRGRRNRSYVEAVHAVFGRRGATVLAWLQHSNLFMTGALRGRGWLEGCSSRGAAGEVG